MCNTLFLQEKVFQYWPGRLSEPTEFGALTVTMLAEEEAPEFERRVFAIAPVRPSNGSFDQVAAGQSRNYNY